MRRRRLRMFGPSGSKSKTLNEANDLECRIYAYYLYVVCSYKNEYYSDYENDDDYLPCLYGFFNKLAKKLGRERMIVDYMENLLSQYEKRGLLIRDDVREDDPLCYNNTNIPYIYVEDKKIDRFLPCGMENISVLEVDLFRCFTATHHNHFLLNLIANFLIKKTPSDLAGPLNKLPAYLTKALECSDDLDFVKKALDLSKNEINMLQCLYRCSIIPGMSSLLDTFSDICKREIYARMLNISVRDFNALVRKDSKLRQYGFLDEDGKIEDDFYECIDAQSMQPFFCDLLKTEELDSTYELESFNVPQNNTSLMSRLLKGDQSVSLLLYGKPGSGKTEYAKALAKKSGLEAYVFNNERELMEDGRINVLSRLNCLLSMSSSDCVYIIDEADSLLRTCDFSFFGMNSPSNNKGTVNKMLEQSQNKIIWIVNFTSQIDESTLRRFTYSYRFESMTRSQLRSITQTKLKPLDLPQEINTQILDMMEHYKVTGASVDNVVKAIKSLGGVEPDTEGGGQGENILQGVNSLLKENALLLNGKSRTRETVNQNFDLSVLNTSMEPQQIVRMVQNAREFAEQTGRTDDASNGIRMLFYGASGTGKTEFARYIAQELGSKIILKRASDILDKYVGGSEKNIRNAFEEAERTQSILLFDEADSFFADRSNAQHSWERTQVNEFLTQMEEFSGILICTTNLKSIMDAAMNRRFHIITEFKPLTEEGIKNLFKKYFPGFDFEDSSLVRMQKLQSVTPGDFGVLSSRIRFMDKAARTQSYIIDELCKIQKEKEGNVRTIGFGM